MENLKRKENPKKYFLLAGGVGVMMVANLQRLNIPYAIIWVGLLIGVCIVLWFRYGNKPAAWVHDESLFILNGLFSPHKLKANEISNLSYKTMSDSEHVIVARLKSGLTQKILIHDRKEHIPENRLANFINLYFMPIERDTSNKEVVRDSGAIAPPPHT